MINYDKWIEIPLKLRYKVQDLSSILLTDYRILIFGGITETDKSIKDNTSISYYDIIDLKPYVKNEWRACFTEMKKESLFI